MPGRKSADTEARLREALRKVRDGSHGKYGLDLSEAERSAILEQAERAALDGVTEIAAELLVKPIVSARFRVTVGAGTSATKLVILGIAALVLRATLLAGVYLILNSPGAARLWK